MNHRCTDYIRIEGEEVEDVESFVYLGSVLDKFGATEADIKRRLALATIAFTILATKQQGVRRYQPLYEWEDGDG